MSHMSKVKQVFIVGSSRSGTTMLGRILANNSSVFTFRELHFFGTLWGNNSNQLLTKKKQVDLLSRLFCIQKYGLFNQKNYSIFHTKSKKLLEKDLASPLEIYKLFLETITNENQADISCEQTPKNLYYLNEILQFFPSARVIILVRDQRDVLLSQKNKWRRRFLGAKKIPLLEAMRSFFNYHPILTAKVWSSAMSISIKYVDHSKVKIVKFEDVLSRSENVLKDICNFLEIDFQENMLNIPLIGSSTENDIESRFIIDGSKISKWQHGGLLDGEIYLSQKISYKMMDYYGYARKKFTIPPPSLFIYLLSFPLKLLFAFVFNIHRMVNILEVIRKRFFVK